MINENLSTFFNTDEFAIVATYNNTINVNGIFDHASIILNDVESTAPRFTCAFTDVPFAQRGDTLVIEGSTYHIVGAYPDGLGIVTFNLQEQ